MVTFEAFKVLKIELTKTEGILNSAQNLIRYFYSLCLFISLFSLCQCCQILAEAVDSVPSLYPFLFLLTFSASL